MWFITGMEEGRVALLIKLHHAVADGMAGLAVLAAFVGMGPELASASQQIWTPAPFPSNPDLFRDNLRQRLAGLGRKLSYLAHPIRGLRRFRGVWPYVAEVFAVRAPRTSLNRPVGRDRRLAIARGSLETYRRIAQVHGCQSQ